MKELAQLLQKSLIKTIKTFICQLKTNGEHSAYYFKEGLSLKICKDSKMKVKMF